jgi:hypothetical protein
MSRSIVEQNSLAAADAIKAYQDARCAANEPQYKTRFFGMNFGYSKTQKDDACKHILFLIGRSNAAARENNLVGCMTDGALGEIVKEYAIISEAIACKEALTALIAYQKIRERELDMYKNSFFSIHFGASKGTKLAACQIIMRVLVGQAVSMSLIGVSNKHFKIKAAISGGRLGGLVKKHPIIREKMAPELKKLEAEVFVATP